MTPDPNSPTAPTAAARAAGVSPDQLVALKSPLQAHLDRHPSPMTDAADPVDLADAKNIERFASPAPPERISEDRAPNASRILVEAREKRDRVTAIVASLEDQLAAVQRELTDRRYELHYLSSIVVAGARFKAAHETPATESAA